MPIFLGLTEELSTRDFAPRGRGDRGARARARRSCLRQRRQLEGAAAPGDPPAAQVSLGARNPGGKVTESDTTFANFSQLLTDGWAVQARVRRLKRLRGRRRYDDRQWRRQRRGHLGRQRVSH